VIDFKTILLPFFTHLLHYKRDYSFALKEGFSDAFTDFSAQKHRLLHIRILSSFTKKNSTLFFYFVLSETILSSLSKTLKCSTELKSAPAVFACRDCSVVLLVLTLQLVRYS